MKNSILLILLCLGMTSKLFAKIDTVVISHKDTIIKLVETDKLKTEYFNILEKTNQQLGIWTNPYGLMVAALGVLFAVMD